MKTFKYRNLRKKNYFEGWYQRITDENNNLNYAFVFAIIKDEKDPHAFIQVFDGIKKSSKYYRYKIEDFHFSNDTLFIKKNYLSLNSMAVKTKDLEISILFSNSIPLKTWFGTNSSMSFLSKLPLECFQEVITIDGTFSGNLIINNSLTNIGGKTYLEKTYGSKFPLKWIWIQGNHFDKEVSLSFSVALVPVLKRNVKGFITILIYKGKEYRFTSYNFSKIKVISNDYPWIEILITKGKYELKMRVKVVDSLKLIAPSKTGSMNLKISESINSLASLEFKKGNKMIFVTSGKYVGCENMYD